MTTTYAQDFMHDGTLIDLVLDLGEGDVRVVLDHEPGHARLELYASEDVDFEPVTARCRGGVLTVDVPPLLGPDGQGKGFAFSLGSVKIGLGSTVQVDAVVHLPRGSQVKVRTRAGDIQLEELAGAVDLKTGSGDIQVERCEGARASSGAGDINLVQCSGGVVSTGSGDVLVGPCPEDLQVRSGSGDVTVGTSGPDATLTVATGSGDVNATLDGGSLEARTGTGDITVTVPRGIPAWLDLSAPLGDVNQRIEGVGAPDDGQPYVSVSARTGTGDVTITH
ncbi:DUF4097 family beta strand repeat-containing protein [Ornithinimicrobium sp. Y1847]|uniref:DUF4097 family beta strand repeat-containing protein n=1 Tax=unclassified Ornithinimicrobium TaxID=2615080 RepID=UPI003B685988